MLGCAEKHTSNILFLIIKYIYKKPPKPFYRPKFNATEVTPYRCILIIAKSFLTWKMFLSEKWFRLTLLCKSISRPVLPLRSVLVVVGKQGELMTIGYKKSRMFLYRANMSLSSFGKDAIHVFPAVSGS